MELEWRLIFPGFLQAPAHITEIQHTLNGVSFPTKKLAYMLRIKSKIFLRNFDLV